MMYISDMEYQVKVCNGRFLAAYAARAFGAIEEALHNKEIDQLTAQKLRDRVDEVIDTFNNNCICMKKIEKKNYLKKIISFIRR